MNDSERSNFQLISHDSTKACCHDSGLHPIFLESPGHSCKPESAATMAPRSESSSHRNYARTTHAYIQCIHIVHSNHNTCINIHTARNSLTHCFLFASVWTQKNLHNQELPRGSKRSMASLSTRTRCVSRRLRSKARCTCG